MSFLEVNPARTSRSFEYSGVEITSTAPTYYKQENKNKNKTKKKGKKAFEKQKRE